MSGPVRTATNLFASAAGFAVNVLMGVLLTPYLVRHLGVGAYGVVPAVMAITSWLSLATLALNTALGRHVTFALGTGDTEEANRYFNTALVAGLGCAALVGVALLAVALHPGWFLRIPAGEEEDTARMAAVVAGAVTISVLSSTFEVATFCKSRFDVRNAIGVAASLLRVAVIVALFVTSGPSITAVGLATLASALANAGGAAWAWGRLAPELRLAPRLFDRGALRALLGTAGWVVVNQLGTLLLVSVDLLFVNRSYGPEEAGRYASVLQWPNLVRGVALALGGALTPPMIELFARGERAAVARYSLTAVKFLGLAMALPAGLVAGLAAPLLQVWLGPGFVSLAPLLVLLVLPLAVSTGCTPMNSVATAANQFRAPALIQCAAGAANLVLMFVLARSLGWGLVGVAAAGSLVLTAKSVLFSICFAAGIAGVPRAQLSKVLGVVVAASVATGGCCWALASRLDLAGFGRLAAVVVSASIAYALVSWTALLTSEERALVLAQLRGPAPSAAEHLCDPRR
jgi:membrane protein EpsK